MDCAPVYCGTDAPSATVAGPLRRRICCQVRLWCLALGSILSRLPPALAGAPSSLKFLHYLILRIIEIRRRMNRLAHTHQSVKQEIIL